MESLTAAVCRRAGIALAVSFVAIFSGCSEADPLNRQSVGGTISLDGSPLPRGTIEFSPVGPGNASGSTIEAGTFELPAERGLAPGDYIVRISAANADATPVEVPGESNQIAKELIPPKYNTESDVKFTVTADGENVFTLEMVSSGS